jgi:hypothetical protein
VSCNSVLYYPSSLLQLLWLISPNLQITFFLFLHACNLQYFFFRTVLFWVITKRVVVISCRRLGTTYRSQFQGSNFLPFLAAIAFVFKSVLFQILLLPFIPCNYLFSYLHVFICNMFALLSLQVKGHYWEFLITRSREANTHFGRLWVFLWFQLDRMRVRIFRISLPRKKLLHLAIPGWIELYEKYVFVFKLLFEHTRTHTVHGEQEQEQRKKSDCRISNYRHISNSVAYHSTSDFTNLIIKPNHTLY